MSSEMGIALVVVLVLVVVVFGPLLSIWSLNTLFALGIQYGFKQWLAMVIINLALVGRSAGKTG
jgi:hypothetical protein